MKTCSSCGKEKTSGEFYKTNHSKDGLTSECKECARARSRAYGNKHSKERTERAKSWKSAHPERVKELARAWSKSHPENIALKNARERKRYYEKIDAQKERSRVYHASHREEIRQAEKLRRANNPEKAREKYKKDARAWRKNHPDKHHENNRKHRVKKMGAIGSHTNQEWLDKISEYGGRCAYCGCTPKKLEEDHIIPLSLGGTDYISNISPACHSCNSSKNNSSLEDWINKRNGKTQSQ